MASRDSRLNILVLVLLVRLNIKLLPLLLIHRSYADGESIQWAVIIIIIMTYYYFFFIIIIIFLLTFPANFGTNPWRNGKMEIGNPHLWKFQTIFSNWSLSTIFVTELNPIRLLGVATLQNWKIDDDGKNPD